jgi:xylitol oxidase
MKANWSVVIHFRRHQLHHPTNVSEIQTIVRRQAARSRVVGSAHSFNDIADTTIDLIALDLYTFTPIIDDQHGIVTVPGSMRYGDLLTFLAPTKWALHNTASLPHISVAGTIATATHGSGVDNKNLATAVIALEFVRADGELRMHVSADSHGEQFNGMVVHLGALGVVTSVTLKLVPRFDMRQDVYLRLPVCDGSGTF